MAGYSLCHTVLFPEKGTRKHGFGGGAQGFGFVRVVLQVSAAHPRVRLGAGDMDFGAEVTAISGADAIIQGEHSVRTKEDVTEKEGTRAASTWSNRLRLGDWEEVSRVRRRGWGREGLGKKKKRGLSNAARTSKCSLDVTRALVRRLRT